MDNWRKPLDGKEESALGELFKKVKPALLVIAANRLKDRCSDVRTHKEDVVQQGYYQFLHAERHNNYPDPLDVLRSAVWQAGEAHAHTCLRETASDLNALSSQHDDDDKPKSTLDKGHYHKLFESEEK
jgi:hypothetical protein